MKKIISFFVWLMALMPISYAYHFSSVASTGQTLYYRISGTTAYVTYPGNYSLDDNLYSGYSMPTGNLTIPSSVTYNGNTYTVTGIGEYAFSGCSGLTSVTIPNSVTSIGHGAFVNCSGLTLVTIPNSVTSIASYAFSGCSGLTSVTIPNSVTSIGIYAFSGCSGLTSVTIPNSVTSIGSYAFGWVRHIEYYGNATGSPWGAISVNGVVDGDFVFSNSQKDTLLAYVGSGENVTIPNSVTSIAPNAFYNCSGLTTVTIGNSVTSIGDGAFSGCSGLTTVTIGNSVTSIGNYAFSGCSGLTSVTIPNSVTGIGNYAFSGCSGLTSVTIGNSVTSIGNSAFSNCSGLTSVTIPNSVTSIRDEAFYGCSGLTSVTIPNSVTSIASYAFAGCSGLMEITSMSSVAPVLGSNAFGAVSTTIPINIPCGSSMSYYSRWNYFSNFIESDGYSFAAITSDSTKGLVDILVAPTCTAPTAAFNAVAYEGYTFSHWSDGNNENPRVLTVVSDTIVVAYFESTTQGIDNAVVQKDVIHFQDGQIVLEGSNGNTVWLYDVNGRILATKQDEHTPSYFDVPASGTYLLKIGHHPARKVVVIR